MTYFNALGQDITREITAKLKRLEELEQCCKETEKCCEEEVKTEAVEEAVVKIVEHQPIKKEKKREVTKLDVK